MAKGYALWSAFPPCARHASPAGRSGSAPHLSTGAEQQQELWKAPPPALASGAGTGGLAGCKRRLQGWPMATQEEATGYSGLATVKPFLGVKIY